MANYIKTLKEDNGDVTYPVTKAGAVYLNSGTDAESKFADCVTAQEIAATSASTPLVGTNMINDKAVTADKIDWTTMSVIDTAYAPGDIVDLSNTFILNGNINNSNGQQYWFLPLNKDLQFVTGCSVQLYGSASAYYFFSLNQDAYPGWGRQNPGTYTGTILKNGVAFTTPLYSGSSNGRIYQYSVTIGNFGSVRLTFS